MQHLAFTLDLDPAVLSTAQQKGAFVNRATGRVRFFTKKRVQRGENAVAFLARPYAAACRSAFGDGPVAVFCAFLFAYPKGASKAEREARREGAPVTSARYGDADNRFKSVQDALVKAGLFADDRLISTVCITKRYTLKKPRIEIVVREDDAEFDMTHEAEAKDTAKKAN